MKKIAVLALSLTLLFSTSSCTAIPDLPVLQRESMTEQEGTDLYEPTPNDQPSSPDSDQPTEQLSNQIVEVNRYYKVEVIDPSTYTYVYTIYNAWGQAVYSETTQNKYFEITMLGNYIVDIATYSSDIGRCHRYFHVMSASFDDSKEYQSVIATSSDYVAYLSPDTSKVIIKNILDDSFYKEFQMPTDLYLVHPMPVFSASLSHDTLYIHYEKNDYRPAFISFRFREDENHSFANYNAILALVQDICTALPTYEEQTDYAAAFGITDAQEIEWLDRLFSALRDLHPAKEEAELSTKHLKSVGYAIKDLNDDGIHELILLCENYDVIAIFSMVNGNPVLLSHYSSERLCVIDDQGLIYETQRNHASDCSPRRLYRIAQGGSSMELIIEIGTAGNDWNNHSPEKIYYKLENGQKTMIDAPEYEYLAEELLPYLCEEATKEMSGLCFIPLDIAASSLQNTTVHQAYLDALANKLKVYNVDTDEYCYLIDCKNKFQQSLFQYYPYSAPNYCALADLDGDLQNELILAHRGSLYIMRHYDGVIYLYAALQSFSYWTSYKLYEGGVCGYDLSRDDQGEYQLVFEGASLRVYSLWSTLNDGDPTYGNCYIGEQVVTKDELTEYLGTLQRNEIAFSPLTLNWNRTVSPQKALELASNYWRTYDGASDAACGTSFTYRILILADHGNYYHIVGVTERGHTFADDESFLGVHHVECNEELLVDTNTGECIPYGMDYISGKG